MTKELIKEGDIFNQLTALKYIKTVIRSYKSSTNKKGIVYQNQYIWSFKCVCGNIIEAKVNNIKPGKRKSCGCEKIKNNKIAGILRRRPETEGPRDDLYCRYRYNAKIRNKSFELNKEYFNKITKQNCHYCGIEPFAIVKGRTRNDNYIYTGIDRIDSKLGYTIENTVPCCKFCNMAKQNYPVEELLKWIDKIKNNYEE
jgi:hypothetical protein